MGLLSQASAQNLISSSEKPDLTTSYQPIPQQQQFSDQQSWHYQQQSLNNDYQWQNETVQDEYQQNNHTQESM